MSKLFFQVCEAAGKQRGGMEAARPEKNPHFCKCAKPAQKNPSHYGSFAFLQKSLDEVPRCLALLLLSQFEKRQTW